MIAIEEYELSKLLSCPVREGICAAFLFESHQRCVMGNLAQRKDDLEVRELPDALNQMLVAGSDFSSNWLVLGRQTSDRIGYHAVDQFQTIIRAGIKSPA